MLVSDDDNIKFQNKSTPHISPSQRVESSPWRTPADCHAPIRLPPVVCMGVGVCVCGACFLSIWFRAAVFRAAHVGRLVSTVWGLNVATSRWLFFVFAPARQSATVPASCHTCVRHAHSKHMHTHTHTLNPPIPRAPAWSALLG